MFTADSKVLLTPSYSPTADGLNTKMCNSLAYSWKKILHSVDNESLSVFHEQELGFYLIECQS
jgi:hypothetical protein